MGFFSRGAYKVRIADKREDVEAAQKLRYDTFIASTGAAERDAGLDTDEFDPICDHVLIELERTGELIACFRMLPLENGTEIERSYSAKYYNLQNLHGFPSRMVEMGRFCVHPDHRNPHVLRIAWAAMTHYVDERGIQLLFGCSSFQGVDSEEHLDALTLLSQKHLGPKRWLPRVKAPKVFQFAKKLRLRSPDPVRGMKLMPPLLRGYLSLGGWVSDHAVIDEDMNTLHVFTGVEINRVPPRMAKLLRA